MQTKEFDVIPGVADDCQVLRRHDIHQATQKFGRSHTTGEGNNHNPFISTPCPIDTQPRTPAGLSF
jgi:hypothetical protein